MRRLLLCALLPWLGLCWGRPLLRRLAGIGAAASCALWWPQQQARAEDSLSEQLKVVRALQTERRKEELIEERDIATQVEKSCRPSVSTALPA